jgi:NADPH:quinone reductase-like Zn-dependent oxidoreductase
MPITATATATATAEDRGPHRGTMRAIVQRAYGTADVLQPERIGTPTARDGEVLVRVHAAGLDRGTWHLMAGYPHAVRLAMGIRRPRQPIPGIDLSGTVVAIGWDVSRFAVGDEVFGFGRGSFAELAVAKEHKVAAKPAGLTHEQAAVIPVSAATALQALDVAGPEPGQHVLVIGASGGVGTYAVQIARARGAVVTGVASAAKLDLVRQVGADHALDYARTDITAGDHRYDAIIDIGGNTPVRRLRRALTPTGTLVIVGGEHGGRWTGMSRQLGAVLLSPFVGQRLRMMTAREHHDGFDRLAALVAAGGLQPAVERTFPLEGAADAMRHLVAGKARGKLVISVVPS